MKLRRGSRAVIYLTLFIGAIVFSFPFVWLVSTSVKVDQELFTADLNILPQRPLARKHSPYFEKRRLDALSGTAQRQAEVLPKLREIIRERKSDLDEDGVAAVADEVYAKLASLAPAELFKGPLDPFIAFARTTFTDVFLNEQIAQRKRSLLLGPIRTRSVDLQDVGVLDDLAPAKRWANQTPKVATLVDDSTDVIKFARIEYDFRDGDTIHLSSTAATPFDASKLQRVQIRIQPDDTWHDVNFELQAAGRKYRAVRRAMLAGYEWTTLTWQFPSADDTSNKIKTWTVLEDIGPATDMLASNQIKLGLFVNQTSDLGAVYNKTIRNYERTLDQIPFWRYVRVSLFLVFANIVLTLLFSSLIAYAFSRITWPGRDFCFVLMLATMMIPGQVTMIPHFLIWKSVGAYNTLTPLWLGAAFGSPFFIFLLRQFMLGIPRDLEDAARLDGCGFLRIYWHVILPLVRPSLAAIAIFTFMGAWNDFLGPLIYIADQRLYSLAFGLYAFSVQVSNSPTLTMAASVLMVTPVIIVFFLAQKYFVEGVTLTGMKG